jgi:hypothetical protein
MSAKVRPWRSVWLVGSPSSAYRMNARAGQRKPNRTVRSPAPSTVCAPRRPRVGPWLDGGRPLSPIGQTDARSACRDLWRVVDPGPAQPATWARGRVAWLVRASTPGRGTPGPVRAARPTQLRPRLLGRVQGDAGAASSVGLRLCGPFWGWLGVRARRAGGLPDPGGGQSERGGDAFDLLLDMRA